MCTRFFSLQLNTNMFIYMTIFTKTCLSIDWIIISLICIIVLGNLQCDHCYHPTCIAIFHNQHYQILSCVKLLDYLLLTVHHFIIHLHVLSAVCLCTELLQAWTINHTLKPMHDINHAVWASSQLHVFICTIYFVKNIWHNQWQYIIVIAIVSVTCIHWNYSYLPLPLPTIQL